jgi:comEA protein
MKQSIATGRFLTLLIALAYGFFLLAACTRLPRNHIPHTKSFEAATSAAKVPPINLNAASIAELEKLPGIGPVLAERIVNYRAENGRFRRAEHLMMVRGISDKKFRELRSLIRVE